MKFEEQAEFLMQSIASHDRQIGELTDGLAQTRSLLNEYIAESRGYIAESREYIVESRETNKSLKLAMSRLGTAMLALNEHTADHKSRIERLEGGRA